MSEQLDLRAGASLILQQLRARWRTLGTALFFALVWSSARVALPILTGKTIDEAIGGGDKELLLTFAIAILAVAAIQGLAAAVRRYFAMSTSYRVEANLRAQLYDQVNQLSLDYHDRTSTGQLMSRASADLHEIQMFAVVIPLNTAFLLIAIGAFAVLLTVNVALAFAAMFAYPIITLLSARFFRRLSPATARVQQDLADVTHVVEENIAGVRTVRSFGREDDEVRKLQAIADRTFDDSMEAARLRTIYTPLFSWLPALSQLVILSFGGYLVLEGQLTAGEFIAFFQYLNMLIFPVQSLGELVPSGQRAMTSAARVWNVLRQRPTITRTPHAGPMPDGGGDLVFEDVQFAYVEGYPVLRDFNLRIPAGASVALVGPTGCGKTTVAKLLPRFYEVQSGQVLIDGTNIRDIQVDDLRRNVGLVFQDTFLFSDTIRSNIAYGRVDATQEEIEHAAALAQASEFIDELPDGYDTVVGEQGFSLSGGQRQRIAIARAILIRPRVLILDDATSSVDASMEQEIRTALRRVMEGRTTIIISHRLSTIALADQVVLIEGGRVIEVGTHNELLRSSPRYAEVLGQLVPAS
ncbi:MAG: ABC transporter ATP-binding protein [Chloroflexi bacterium]|nr:ABC transporter ATP-binding protein [Chloroflexota bacterium]MCI0819700.1 ABC transporter ATP-binding protein [Chloroflexota bacterium]MCI0882956.1 ABC transporter ATP-binding protein [Chloroflexota bacterium]MCI0885296.1 ABC transporter ATP-binding protein [Chloroflexota bacterium]